MGELRYLALSLLPPAAIGGVFERAIERRLGGTTSVCAGQVAGGLAMLLADLAPERRASANALDHLAAGLGQAAALMPGVSRSGAALAAGCAGALASSLACLPLLSALERRGVLRTLALYRIALGVTVLALGPPTTEVEWSE